MWWSESTGNFGSPTALQLLLRTLLAAWRVWRLLQASPLLRASWHRQARSPNSLGAEQYKMIWVCRDAELAAGYIPRVNLLVYELHRSLYGKPATASEWKDRLGHFIDFTIYVTDTDDDSVARLKRTASATNPHPFGALFGPWYASYLHRVLGDTDGRQHRLRAAGPLRCDPHGEAAANCQLRSRGEGVARLHVQRHRLRLTGYNSFTHSKVRS